MFRDNLFQAVVKEKRSSLQEVAACMGITSPTLYRKLHGESEFTRDEIQAFRELLELSAEDIDNIFFAPEVTET